MCGWNRSWGPCAGGAEQKLQASDLNPSADIHSAHTSCLGDPNSHYRRKLQQRLLLDGVIAWEVMTGVFRDDQNDAPATQRDGRHNIPVCDIGMAGQPGLITGRYSDPGGMEGVKPGSSLVGTHETI